MTDNGDIKNPELICEENNNCVALEGAINIGLLTLSEKNNILRKNDSIAGSDIESDSDVINSFIENTSKQVGYVVMFVTFCPILW